MRQRPASERLRAALVGCGRIGGGYGERPGSASAYTHAGAYSRAAETILVAACDSASERLAEVGARWGIAGLYSDFRALLDQEKVDLVSIASPPASHPEIVAAALGAGVRGVFCEKPLALTYAESQTMVEACERAGVPLAVNHPRRWDRGHRAVRELVRAGELGHLQVVRGLYHGDLWHVGIHLIDTLRFFFGEVIERRVLAADRDRHGQWKVDARLTFVDGISAVLQCCDREFFDVFEIDLVGSLGRIQINQFGLEFRYWVSGMSREFPGDKELCTARSPVRAGMRNALVAAVRNLAGAVRAGDALACSGREALASMQVADQLVRSAGSGQQS